MSTPSKRFCPEGAVVPSTSGSSSHSIHQEQLNVVDFSQNTLTGCNVNISQNQNGPQKVGNLHFEVQTIEHQIIGRDEDVRAVFKLLLEERDELKSRVVITGVGGKGKTTLALLCANEIRAGKNIKIKNVAFLRAASDAEFKTSVEGLASLLNINLKLPLLEIFKQIAGLYKDGSLLLVLDNLEELQVIKSVLDLPSNPTQTIYLLATSQNRAFGNHFQEYELSFLSRKNTENLIDSVLGEEYVKLKNEDGDLICLLRELCGRLAGLPLSITHAAAFIREEINDQKLFDENIDCSTYKETIKSYLDNFDSKLSDPILDQFITVDNKSAFTAIQLNLQKLLGANFNSAKPDVTAEVLAVIGHLNPDSIRQEVLDVLFGEASVKRALIRLIKFSIITKADGYYSSYYRIHRTTQKVVKALLKDICQDKVALWSLFKSVWEIKIGFKIGNMKIAEKELEEIIGRAFSKLIDRRFSFNYVCRDKECKLCRQSSSWPLPHKLLLASKDGFDTKIMISVLKLLETDLKSVGAHNATLLHLAMLKTLDGELIRFLTGQGLTIDAVTKEEATPLHVALESIWRMLKYGSIRGMPVPETFYEGLNLLISYSTVNTKDEKGRTPLNLLTRMCFYFNSNEEKSFCLNLAQRLTKANADVNTRCNKGWTPVHYAVFNENPDLLKLLIRFKADVNIQNDYGRTALHLAVDSACFELEDLFDPHKLKSHEGIDKLIEVLSVLMSCGARIDIVDNNGETVVDIANRAGQKYLANWLQKPRETLSNFDNDVPIPTDLDWDCTAKLWIDRNSKTRPICDHLIESEEEEDEVSLDEEEDEDSPLKKIIKQLKRLIDEIKKTIAQLQNENSS